MAAVLARVHSAPPPSQPIVAGSPRHLCARRLLEGPMSIRNPTIRGTSLGRSIALLMLGLSAVALLVACSSDENTNSPDAGTMLNGRAVYAVTFDNRLLL